MDWCARLSDRGPATADWLMRIGERGYGGRGLATEDHRVGGCGHNGAMHVMGNLGGWEVTKVMGIPIEDAGCAPS